MAGTEICLHCWYHNRREMYLPKGGSYFHHYCTFDVADNGECLHVKIDSPACENYIDREAKEGELMLGMEGACHGE
jgi:hypothetical protein